MKGSAEVWRLLVGNGSDVVEISAFPGDEEELKMNGEIINTYLNQGTGLRRLPGGIFHVSLQATYEVSSSLNLRFTEPD